MRSIAILSPTIVALCSLAAHAQTLTQQGQCAAQAKTAYAEFQAEWEKSEMELVTSDSESHYNAKLQKCLILRSMMALSKRTRKLSNFVVLSDAYERRTYAYYYMGFDRDLSDFQCILTPNHRDTKRCTTRAEFDAYVSEYLEQ